MLNNIDSNKVKAILTQLISYTKEGEEVNHNPGTTVIVDLDQGIAFHEGDHFDIDKTEYKVMYLN